jgi:hypothetical protein
MFDHELLAAHAAIRHFRNFCEGCSFQLWTDHKLLVTALSRVSAPVSPRQLFYLAVISEFNVQMLYLPDLRNVVEPKHSSVGGFQNSTNIQKTCTDATYLTITVHKLLLSPEHLASRRFQSDVRLIYMLTSCCVAF